jgi:3-hydroxyisobutyrate dehydrogenase-like beta-hydroxyacid dehydrogenase
MKKIAVVGCGTMGAGMVLNFLKKGHAVSVWNRSSERLEPLVAAGAVACRTPREAAEQAELVFEVTADDSSSRLVWTGAEGILAGAKAGCTLVVSSTLSAAWTDELARLCAITGFDFLDMPLTGGRAGAENGQLMLLVGGDEQKFQALLGDLSSISTQQIYFGKVGNGMRYKLVLNALQAAHVAAFGEAMHLAQAAGLDLGVVGENLAQRPGGFASQVAWKGMSQPPEHVNFAVQWIAKDVSYALQLGGTPGKILPALSEVLEDAKARGLGEQDWTAINR